MCKNIHIRNTKNKFYLDESKQSMYLLDVVRGKSTAEIVRVNGGRQRGCRAKVGVYNE